MTLTSRQISVLRAVLAALNAVPADLPLPEATLRADAARGVTPRATTVELDWAIAYLDTHRRIAGLQDEIATLWQITAAGRLWLAQNP